jgi:hypothetical protein
MRAIIIPSVAILAACGGSGSGGVDAPAAMTCGVALGTSPMPAGRTVVFSRLDGSMIGVAATDTAGAASRDDCDERTLVTVFDASSSRAITVEVGGNEVAHLGTALFPGGLLKPLVANVGSTGAPAGSFSFSVTSGIATTQFNDLGGDVTFESSTEVNGKNPAEITVLAIARSTDNAAFVYRKDVPSATTSASPILLDGWEVSDVDGLAVTLSDAPAAAVAVDASFRQLVDGVEMTGEDAPSTTTLTAPFYFDRFPGFADHLLVTSRAYFASGARAWVHQCVTPDTTVVNVAGASLGPALEHEVPQPGAGDRHTFAWSGSDPMATYTKLDALWDTPTGVGEWQILLEGAVPSPFVTPELPAELAVLRHSADITYARFGISYGRLSWTDYEGLLEDAGAAFGISQDGCRGIPDGASHAETTDGF